MKYQPKANYVSDDVVFTPSFLAEKIVRHFKPEGKILEPCCGSGAFLEFMPNADWCEISKGRDFMDAQGHYDWIVTNPPWSKIKDFLQKAFWLSDNVVFLMTVNHVFTKARIRLMRESGFGIAEIAMCEMPKYFPQSGFQLGAIHYKRGHEGPTKMTYF